MELLTTRNLSKSFGKKRVFFGVNLKISKGQIIGLIGNSGEGKSTLIKTLLGFLEPTSGEIAIHSQSRNPIGFSMQENALYDNLTVKQNLNYFGGIYKIPHSIKKERINTLLKQLNLEEYRHILFKHLSGGTKKRVDLACALLPDPDLIILDEPLLGLDPGLITNIGDIIVNLNKQGKTFLISSHRVAELAKISTHLILLKKGEVFEMKESDLKFVYT